MTDAPMTNEWKEPAHVRKYLAKLKDIPHRAEGEAALLSEVSAPPKRVLDLGCGDGHLLSLVLAHCPAAQGVGLDLSPTMLNQARKRFEHDHRIQLIEHDMEQPLPDLGTFDCVVSSFAIHHCPDERKRQLYAEVFTSLEPAGVFCNLEHVSSPTQRIHDRFVKEMGMTPDDEDPSNKLLDVETQLCWLREIGFEDVDCHWKWRELALLAARKPTVRSADPELVVDDAPTPAEVRWLDNQLEQFNRERVGRLDFKPISLVARQDGKVIAGLKAMEGWNWLYIQVLWVKETFRRRGLASRLLEQVERNAVDRGCVGACLSPFSFQAPGFYERRGYRIFGRIDEYPPGGTLYFLSKRLAN